LAISSYVHSLPEPAVLALSDPFQAPLILLLVQQGDASSFRIPIYSQGAFLGIMAPIFIYLPGSPSYFAAKHLDDRGRAAIRKINGGIEGFDLDAEYAIIKITIIEERAMRAELGMDLQNFRDLILSYVACLRGVNARRTIASALPACLQQLTGLSFFSTYAPLFFRQSGFFTAIITAISPPSRSSPSSS